MEFNIMDFIKPERQTYESKGRYKVNLFYWFNSAIKNHSQLCDTRHYNTEQERELYIKQSINAHRKFAQAYHTDIRALKVDGKYWNITRLANNIDDLN